MKIKKCVFISLVYISFFNYIEARPSFSKYEYSLNFFRNPSIGGEFRYEQVSIHAGYYVTNFEPNITTRFYKLGISYWFFPINLSMDKQKNPSSFYISQSYAKGINLDYKEKDTSMTEIGFRWVIWKGFNFRLGINALVAQGETTKFNPTPGISYTFFYD